MVFAFDDMKNFLLNEERRKDSNRFEDLNY